LNDQETILLDSLAHMRNNCCTPFDARRVLVLNQSLEFSSLSWPLLFMLGVSWNQIWLSFPWT